MHKLASIAALVGLLCVHAPAWSARWVSLGVDARGNTWHIDTDSIVREDRRVTAWKRIDFSPPYPHLKTGAPLWRAFVLNVIDCDERRTDLKAIGLLDPQGSIIAVAEDGSSEMPWPPAARLPLLETAMTMVCG